MISPDHFLCSAHLQGTSLNRAYIQRPLITPLQHDFHAFFNLRHHCTAHPSPPFEIDHLLILSVSHPFFVPLKFKRVAWLSGLKSFVCHSDSALKLYFSVSMAAAHIYLYRKQSALVRIPVTLSHWVLIAWRFDSSIVFHPWLIDDRLKW